MNSSELNEIARRASDTSLVDADQLGPVEIAQALVDRERLLQAVNELGELRYLWNGLELLPADTVTGAVLLAKVSNFEKGSTVIAFSTTRDLDFITQIGIMRAATIIVEGSEMERAEGDE